MASRQLELHALLVNAMLLYDPLGEEHVYFQAPEKGMKYPAIKYSKSEKRNESANNGVYNQQQYYDIIVIERTPDKPLSDIISKFPGIRWNAGYIMDNLYHEKYTIYF